MDLDVEILGLLSKLGHKENNDDGEEVYTPDGNSVRTLKEIRRLLNKDAKEDEDFGLESLCEVRAIQRHFIPLLRESTRLEHSHEVIDEILKLLVILTLPNTRWAEAHANELRRAVVDESIAGRTSPLALIASRVEGALSTDASKRSEDDRKRVDLLLFFVRNMLVPSPKEEARDEFLIEMHKESILDIVLHFTNHVARKNNKEWDLLLLEIFFFLFRGVDMNQMIDAGTHRSQGISDGSRNQNVGPAMKIELARALEELQKNQKNRNHNLPARHSHFGGIVTLVRDGDHKLMPSIYGARDPHRLGGNLLPKSIAQRKRRVQDHSVVSSDMLSAKRKGSSNGVEECLRDVAGQLVDKAYSVLFSSIILDFRREDARIKPEDEVRFVWMIRFFTRYSRLQQGDWTKSSVMTTMDLWSFQYVVNRVIDNLEQKAWASLESSVGALLEMMINLKEVTAVIEGKSLKNAVFYELRERLEVIPKLLKMWDPASNSREHLRNLTILGDVILETLEDMADEGAVAKARSKAAKRAERKNNQGIFSLTWSADETHALASGVRARQSEYDLNVMKAILKDPSLGPVFEDQKRTPQQLLARWMQVRAALSGGKTLEQFIRDDADKEEEEEKEDEAAANAERPEILEKQIDFFGALRAYLSNNIYRNFSRLIDPACCPDGDAAYLRDTESHRLVAKFFRRLRQFDKGLRTPDSLEPILWHVEQFDAWRRCLLSVARSNQVKMHEDTKDLVKVLQSTLRRFFRHSEQNKLIFTEALFWRTKQDNVFVSRMYNSQSRNRKDRASEEEDLLKQQHEDELDELDAKVEMDDDDEEEEYVEREERPELKESERSRAPQPERVPAKGQKESKPAPPLLRRRGTKNAKAADILRRDAKSKAKAGQRVVKFSLDLERLNQAVSIALSAGVSAEAFTCLLRAFERVKDDQANDVPFIPLGLQAADLSFESKEMHRVMLCLHMCPPNRIPNTRMKNLFTCETYWRLPSIQPTSLQACIGGLNDALMAEPSLSASSALSDVDWCASDNDQDQSTPVPGQVQRESDESGIDEDHMLVSEQEQPRAGESRTGSKVRLLRGNSSSDEEVDHYANVSAEESEKDLHASSSTGVAVTVLPPQGSQKRRRVVSSDEEN